MIENIVRNGMEAMPQGGTMTIDAEEVTVDGKNSLILHPGYYIRISIKDSGIGIRKEDLSRIDPYFTTKTAGGIKGLGLGLSLCDSIPKHHKGAVVESELGEGARFILFLLADAAP
jgi:two-component system cell cycle sensor histidine kinase/response regulator CckA